jgi:hypothetical protein
MNCGEAISHEEKQMSIDERFRLENFLRARGDESTLRLRIGVDTVVSVGFSDTVDDAAAPSDPRQATKERD